MATPANIACLAVGVAVGVGGAFVAELELPVAFMLTITVTSLLVGLNLIFFGREEKKAVKPGRGKPAKAAKAPEPKKKPNKKPAPAKKPAKKVVEEVESETPAPPAAPAPAPAPARRAPAPAPAPTPAPAAVAPVAAAPADAKAAAKKKKNKKPKDEVAAAPQASKAPAPKTPETPAAAEEDGGGDWVQIPMTVQKKKKPKPEELEKGKKAAPVEKTDMKVTGKSIGAIIGPKGINLQAIQSACDVTISIPKDRKPGKDDPVTISIEGGTADSRQSARANIQSLIDNGYSKITHGPDFTMQTFSVDGKKLGQVIGHKGETVQAIQNASGAKINTSNGSNVISIVGTRDRVQSARQIIDELINDGYSNALLKDGAVRQEVVYPRPLLGRLIGKNGANTKRIQKETRTKIVIPDPGSDNQNIVVFGTPADVERAAALILETLKVEKKPAAEGEEEEDEMAGWTAPVSGDDAWDAADRAGPADGWSSLVPQPGSAW